MPPRPLACLILDLPRCAVLREAIKPLVGGNRGFCVFLYILMHALETDPDVGWLPFPLEAYDILLINQYLSAADGPEAIDLLQQSRAALYELESGETSVSLASSVRVAAIFDVEVRENPESPEDSENTLAV